MDVQVAFPDSTSAEADRLAEQLRLRLLEQGLPAGAVVRARVNDENMDIGATLQLAQLGLEAFVAMHGAFEVSRWFAEFRARHRTVLLFTTKDGASVRVDAKTTAAQIVDFLKAEQG